MPEADILLHLLFEAILSRSIHVFYCTID